jgi:hypothetical protein
VRARGKSVGVSDGSGRSNASFLSARSTIFGYVPPGIARATLAASTSAETSSAVSRTSGMRKRLTSIT